MPKLNIASLVAFEKAYYAVPSMYPNLRYGQALTNNFTFNADQKELAEEANLFHETDSTIARSVAWAMVNYYSD